MNISVRTKEANKEPAKEKRRSAAVGKGAPGYRAQREIAHGSCARGAFVLFAAVRYCALGQKEKEENMIFTVNEIV